MDEVQQEPDGKVVLLIFVGVLSALLGYVLTPHSAHIADTYPVELYLPAFFMLIGAGLVVLGLRSWLIDLLSFMGLNG